MMNQKIKAFFSDHPNHPSLVIVFSQYNQPNLPIRQNGSFVRIPLSKRQHQYVLAILNRKESDDTQVNATVTKPGLPKITSRNWIIDSGATDHISSSPKLFSHENKNCSLPPVLLPSGEKANIVAK